MGKKLILFFSVLLLIMVGWATFRSSPPATPKVSQLPSEPSAHSLIPSPRPTIFIKDLEKEITAILKEVDALEDTDQPGLERLFSKMRDQIQTQPKEMINTFEKWAASFPNMPLKHSFFLIHCFLYDFKEPNKVLDTILRISPTDNGQISDPHGHIDTPTERYRKVVAFSLRHSAEAIQNGKWDSEKISRSAETVLPQIRRILQEERSMDISLEAAALFRLLKPNSENEIEHLIKARPQNEHSYFRM